MIYKYREPNLRKEFRVAARDRQLASRTGSFLFLFLSLVRAPSLFACAFHSLCIESFDRHSRRFVLSSFVPIFDIRDLFLTFSFIFSFIIITSLRKMDSLKRKRNKFESLFYRLGVNVRRIVSTIVIGYIITY